MRIEICIENEFEDFDHEGYYDSIDDAIKALYVLKLNEELSAKRDNAKTNLEIAKKIIEENITDADCGLFNSRNLVGDPLVTIYHKDGLTIDICYHWAYFEVFGLSADEFKELEIFYEDLQKWREKKWESLSM